MFISILKAPLLVYFAVALASLPATGASMQDSKHSAGFPVGLF